MPRKNRRGFAEEPPIGTEPLTPATANNSAAVLAIAHRLLTTSVNASKTQTKLGTPCLPELSRFIPPPKEARFTVINQCVAVTGRVVWTHYFNNDGDANFDVVLDAPYKDMLGPGSYSRCLLVNILEVLQYMLRLSVRIQLQVPVKKT